MTTATPSSVTFAEKKRLWNEFKYDTFEEISKDKSTMFNYFLLNNDIFRMISKKDEMAFKYVCCHAGPSSTQQSKKRRQYSSVRLQLLPLQILYFHLLLPAGAFPAIDLQSISPSILSLPALSSRSMCNFQVI